MIFISIGREILKYQNTAKKLKAKEMSFLDKILLSLSRAFTYRDMKRHFFLNSIHCVLYLSCNALTNLIMS